MGKSILLSKIRTEIRRRGLSYRTEQTYIGWITRYIYYHNLEHPKNLREPEVVEFLNHLVTQRGVPESIQTQAKTALQFFYKNVLGTPLKKLTGIVKGETPYICRSFNRNRKRQIRAS